MDLFVLKDEGKHWDDYVERSSLGTFFHLTGWKRVIERTYGYSSIYLYALDQAQVVGCLPLFHVKARWFSNALISVPFAVCGGLCAEEQRVSEALFRRACELGSELGVDYIEFRHVQGHHLTLSTKDLYVTFERPIYDDLEKNMAAIPRKQRRMIRQGEKFGLTSTLGGIEDLHDFYNLYAHSLRNLGTPVFPYAFFKNLMEEFGNRCRILSVWHEGRKTAAVLTFLYKDRVMPYYAGAHKDFFRYAVNDFMYWELMRYGCEKGYKIFDFGRSRKGTGSYDFKRHWGFEPRPLQYQYYMPHGGAMPNVSPSNPKFRLFIWIWKHLPISLTKVIGPRIVRHLP